MKEFTIEMATQAGFKSEEELEIAKKYYDKGLSYGLASLYYQAGFKTDEEIKIAALYEENGGEGNRLNNGIMNTNRAYAFYEAGWKDAEKVKAAVRYIWDGCSLEFIEEIGRHKLGPAEVLEKLEKLEYDDRHAAKQDVRFFRNVLIGDYMEPKKLELFKEAGFTLKNIEDAEQYYNAGFNTSEKLKIAKEYYDAGFKSKEKIELAIGYIKNSFSAKVAKELRRLKIDSDEALKILSKSENSEKEKAKTDIELFREIFESKYTVSDDNAWKKIWNNIDTRVVNWLEKNGLTPKLVKSFYANKEPTDLKNIFIARFLLLPAKSTKSEKDSKSAKIYKMLKVIGIKVPGKVPENFSSIKSDFDKNALRLYDVICRYEKLNQKLLEYWEQKDNINKLYNEQKTIKNFC